MKKTIFQFGALILVFALLSIYFQNCNLKKSSNIENTASTSDSVTTTTFSGCSAAGIAGHCE